MPVDASKGVMTLGPVKRSVARLWVSDDFDALFAYHYGLSKPIVAAINGPVAGVGLALACFVDIRFAAPGIKLTTAHGLICQPNMGCLGFFLDWWVWEEQMICCSLAGFLLRRSSSDGPSQPTVVQ